MVSPQICSAMNSRSITIDRALRMRTSSNGGFEVFTGRAYTPRYGPSTTWVPKRSLSDLIWSAGRSDRECSSPAWYRRTPAARSEIG
jgi:hypothetical protein